MKEYDPACDGATIFCLHIFRKTSQAHQICEFRDVVPQEDGVVKKFLVAFVAKCSLLTVQLPWAVREYPLALSARAIRRSAKEALCHIMMR